MRDAKRGRERKREKEQESKEESERERAYQWRETRWWLVAKDCISTASANKDGARCYWQARVWTYTCCHAAINRSARQRLQCSCHDRRVGRGAENTSYILRMHAAAFIAACNKRVPAIAGAGRCTQPFNATAIQFNITLRNLKKKTCRNPKHPTRTRMTTRNIAVHYTTKTGWWGSTNRLQLYTFSCSRQRGII